MFAHSYSTKQSRTCYGGRTPYALLNIFRWRQKKDGDEVKSRTATGREFQFGGDPAICLREEAICAKVYRRTDRRTDDGHRAIAFAHSWNELKTNAIAVH